MARKSTSLADLLLTEEKQAWAAGDRKMLALQAGLILGHMSWYKGDSLAGEMRFEEIRRRAMDEGFPSIADLASREAKLWNSSHGHS